LTNRQIGSHLVITERTAASHIEHILEKLHVRSRTQIAMWAARHDPSLPAAPADPGSRDIQMAGTRDAHGWRFGAPVV
jgi:hypothetical protein